MATTVKLKRGLDSARTGITPAEGELLYTTDTKSLYVGDGTTAGGNPVAGGAGGGTGGITIDGPSSSFYNTTSTYTITNYDEFSTITISVSLGDVYRVGDTITLTTPASGSVVNLTVNIDGSEIVKTIVLRSPVVNAGLSLDPGTFNASIPTVEQLDATRFILCYSGGTSGQYYAKILTVSGTTVTGGPTITISSTNNSAKGNIGVINPNKVIIAYQADTQAYVKVLNISGTTITQGTALAITSATGSGYFLDIAALSETSAIVIYRDGAFNNYCYAKAIAIQSGTGTSVTAGAMLTFAYTVAGPMQIQPINSTQALACFVSGTMIFGGVLTVSGTTVSGTANPLSIGNVGTAQTISLKPFGQGYLLALPKPHSVAGAFINVVGTTIYESLTLTIGTGMSDSSDLALAVQDDKRFITFTKSGSIAPTTISNGVPLLGPLVAYGGVAYVSCCSIDSTRALIISAWNKTANVVTGV